jgi:flagellar assembly factor FliW
MDVVTPRFGVLNAFPADILQFDEGLIGLSHCRQWVVLADAQNPALAWLQNLDDPDVALGVVSPRRFVPEYRLCVSRQDLEALGVNDARQAQVVAIVSRHADGLAVNLRAPLVINVAQRRGRQVIAKESWPIRKLLASADERRLSA